MTTRILRPDHENGDGRLDKKCLESQYDEIHRVKTDVSSGVPGIEETFASGSVEEHQQHVQGRGNSSNSSSRQRARTFPSRLSRWDLESISGDSNTEKTKRTRKLVWGSSWWWWKDSPRTKITCAFGTVLLVIIGATFMISVYLHHEALTSRLVVVDGMPSKFCSNSIMPIYDNLLRLQQEHEGSEGELTFDMSFKIPGC